jgi:hypothetical protein
MYRMHINTHIYFKQARNYLRILKLNFKDRVMFN